MHIEALVKRSSTRNVKRVTFYTRVSRARNLSFKNIISHHIANIVNIFVIYTHQFRALIRKAVFFPTRLSRVRARENYCVNKNSRWNFPAAEFEARGFYRRRDCEILNQTLIINTWLSEWIIIADAHKWFGRKYWSQLLYANVNFMSRKISSNFHIVFTESTANLSKRLWKFISVH